MREREVSGLPTAETNAAAHLSIGQAMGRAATPATVFGSEAPTTGRWPQKQRAH